MAVYPPPNSSTTSWNSNDYYGYSSSYQSQLYLPLSGGSVSGNLTISSLVTTAKATVTASMTAASTTVTNLLTAGALAVSSTTVAGMTIITTSATSAAPLALTNGDHMTVVSAEAASSEVYISLPVPLPGCNYQIVNASSLGVLIKNTANTRIKMAGSASSTTTGYIESTAIGASVQLIALNASIWIASNYESAWTVA